MELAQGLSDELVSKALGGVYGTFNSEDDPSAPVEQRIARLRAAAIGAAIDACVDAFFDNCDAVMTGTFNHALVEQSSKAEAFKKLKQLSRKRIFTAKRKTELEISGRQIIRYNLDHFFELFKELATFDWKAEALAAERPYWGKIIRATQLESCGITDVYTAMHSLADFVSGMTDRYAVKVMGMISGRGFNHHRQFEQGCCRHKSQRRVHDLPLKRFGIWLIEGDRNDS